MAFETQGANGQGGVGGILSSLNVEDAQQVMEQAREAMDQGLKVASDFIRERPIVCLAGALAFGYIVGKIVSR